jgi:hypothetical protein
MSIYVHYYHFESYEYRVLVIRPDIFSACQAIAPFTVDLGTCAWSRSVTGCVGPIH